MVSLLTLPLCIVCGVVPLGLSRTAPMASKGLSGHVLQCAGAMGSLRAPPALGSAIGSFLAAGGGCLSPSLLVGAGAAGLGADMAAVRVSKKETEQSELRGPHCRRGGQHFEGGSQAICDWSALWE